MRYDDVSISVRLNLGARIRTLRKSQGLSQYRFSEMTGIDRSYLIGVEKGRRNVSIDNLGRISAGLGISLSDMMKGVDDIYLHVRLP